MEQFALFRLLESLFPPSASVTDAAASEPTQSAEEVESTEREVSSTAAQDAAAAFLAAHESRANRRKR